MSNVLDFIKRYFSIRVDSLDEFIDTIEREGGTSVTGRPRIKTKNIKYFAAGVIVGDCEYWGLFQSKTRRGRQIKFKEFYNVRFGVTNGFLAEGNANLYALRALITTDERLQRIKQRLSYVETALVGPEGQMDEITRQRMYKAAEEHELTLF